MGGVGLAVPWSIDRLSIWLSENFTLGELEYSDTAIENGWSNLAPREAIVNLTVMVREIPQKLRDYIGVPLLTLSGYRSPQVNRAVGGADHSLHQIGGAIDCRSAGISNEELIQIAQRLKLPIDKAIDELPHSSTGGWTHFQTPRNMREKPRGEVWLWTGEVDANGKPIYERMA